MSSEQNYYKMMLNYFNFSQNTLPTLYLNPIPPYFQFTINQQTNQVIKNLGNSKKFTDSSCQTEQTSLEVKKKEQKNEYIIQQEDETLKQFPFPNKQKLFDVFKCTSNKKKDIQNKIQAICSPKTKLLNYFYKSIGQKIISFKKTKEQIIKFLIRRAWKKQEDGAGEARQKYYSQYKSMNSAYLTNIFNDPSFVSAYEDMLKNFQREFDSYNSQRFNRFYDYLLHCYVNNNLNQFKTSKECKSKLPYPLFWKEHIFQIANNIYETYSQNSNNLDNKGIQEGSVQNLKDSTQTKKKILTKFKIKE